MPRAAVTIDVDSLRCYSAIHGLPPPPLDDDPIYTVALPRFFDLIEEAAIPATFFLIGEDAPAHAAGFERVSSTGSEIASHSFHHDYALSTRRKTAIESDLIRAHEALVRLAPDGDVVGFRAPGYNTSPALLEAAVACGYRYDSSLLPAPLYFTARAAAIALYRVRGRRSSSLVGSAAAFFGPLEPYQTSPVTPWRVVTDGPLLEIPIAVEPRTRTPLIGTALTTFPARIFDTMVERALRTLPFFNFELHAIDLLDRSDPGIPAALVDAQRDLQVPWATKRARFARLFDRLRHAGEVVTLKQLVSS